MDVKGSNFQSHPPVICSEHLDYKLYDGRSRLRGGSSIPFVQRMGLRSDHGVGSSMIRKMIRDLDRHVFVAAVTHEPLGSMRHVSELSHHGNETG